MKNTLISNYQEYFYQAIKILNEKKIIKPIYWLTSNNIQSKVNKNYPEALTHDYFDCVKGKLLKNIKEDLSLKIDTNFLLKFQKHEFIVMNLLERNNAHSGSFNYLERKYFFYKMMRYWYSVIKSLNIELVIFEEEPHQASDYILYIISKYLNIKTYITIRTLPELGFLVTDDIEIQDKALNNFNNKKISEELKLSTRVQNIFNTINGEFDRALGIQLYDQVEFNKPKKKNFFKILKKLPSYFNQLFHFKSDQKVANYNFENSNLLYIQYVVSKLFLIIKKIKRKSFYESIAQKEINTEKKFVLFGLQYQPEKSTCPNGGYFVDQILAIKLLSQLTPNNYKIYVKEHPSQFVSSYARYGDRMRDLNFYDQILNIQKVSIISSREDTYRLIDKCKFVASVGGSICVESVIRGKPALQFGKSWYDSCDYIFKIKNKEDLIKIFSKADKIIVDRKKVISFLKKIDFICHKGTTGGQVHLQNLNISSAQNSKVHAQALETYLND
jgi:hypothetical protein